MVRVIACLLPDRFPTTRLSSVVPLVVPVSFSVSLSLPVAVSVPITFSVPFTVPVTLVLSLGVSFSVSVAFSVSIAVSIPISVPNVTFSVPVAVSITISVSLSAIPQAFSFLVSVSVSVVPGEGVGGARGVLVVGGRKGAPSGLPPVAAFPSLSLAVLLPRLRRGCLERNTPAVHGRPSVPRRPARAVPVPRPPPVLLVPQEGLVHPHPRVAIVTPPVLRIQGIGNILPQTHVTLTGVLPAACLLLPPAGGAPRASLGRVYVAILGAWKA